MSCSHQLVFAGDSHGCVHVYRSEMRHGQLQQLVWCSKAQVQAAGGLKARGVLQVCVYVCVLGEGRGTSGQRPLWPWPASN